MSFRFTLTSCLCAAMILVSGHGIAAAECPDTALGTERVIEMSDRPGEAFGTAQHQALPLKPGEVVLTFDDGPRPETTPLVLDALRAQCVKATFFMVGQMLEKNPEVALKVLQAGHSIGLHAYVHRKMSELSPEDQIHDFTKVQQLAATTLKGQFAPAYRFPFLDETPTLTARLKAQGYNVMSIDLAIDDWIMGETPATVEAKLFNRLEAARSGIILMHDVQDVTAQALPHILTSLKAKGYKVVALHWKPAGS